MVRARRAEARGDERAARVGLDVALVADALGALSGPTLLLGPKLEIVAASPEVEALLGVEVPQGALAPALLCGQGDRRPVAEALAAGRPVSALVPQPGIGPGARMLRVRALPLGPSGAGGFLVLLADAGRPLGDGAVEFHGMWTQSELVKDVFRVVERVARDDVTVLVRGETGAGKELVARAVHELSPRRRGPFRAINCAALPPTLLESELFGHAKGAFTGALRDMPGHMQLAHKGTLFLDEVAELPLELQAKLLRVLETRSVVPVGAREPTPIDVRIVSATHRALRREVEAGRFRADLLYRLRVIPIFLPPLRERTGDVSLLVDKLVVSMNEVTSRRVERVEPAALAALERHDWPGNVRELKNVLAYAYAMGDGPVLRVTDLPPELMHPALAAAPETGAASAPAPHLSPEAQRVAHALERAGGNRERAAKLLGVSRVTLWRRMRALGLGG
jgi:transcriptional regulator with PAS, ATPase and Fis domain